MRMLFRWIFPILLVMVFGMGSYAVQSANANPPVMQEAISNYSSGYANFEVIASDSSGYGLTNRSRFEARLWAFTNSGEEHPVRSFGLISVPADSQNIEIGSSYRCYLNLAPLKSDTRASFRGTCAGSPVRIAAAAASSSVVSAIREAFLGNLQGISPDSAGLVAGLAIGDTSQLSEKIQAQMKAVGLSHLTAVSGANCAIVVGLVFLTANLVSRRRWVRTLIGVSALLAYVALVGPEPSVVRSAFMAAIVLLAVALGRPAAGLSALGLSVLVLLCIDPWLSTDFGFMLSVSATLGLLVFTVPLFERLRSRIPDWLALPLAVSAAAQLMCLPVLLQLQDGIATYSLLANLLAEPVVPAITVLGILACVFSVPLPALSTIFGWLASIAAHWIVIVASWLAGLPGGVIGWPSGVPGALAGILVVAATGLTLKASSIRIRRISALLILITISVTAGSTASSIRSYLSWPNGTWDLVACDVGQGDAFVMKSAGDIAVIDVGRDDKAIKTCLDKLQITHIDLLVLTHFDLDHIGGLDGALAGRSVQSAMLSPFPDERWAANSVRQKLEEHGADLFSPFAGITGSFGEFRWQVLNPAKGEGEDSNDASLAMLWRGPRFNFLSLADLGESAQMRLGASSSQWLGQGLDDLPMILKVAHHGSGDQFPELIEATRPDVCLISVGAQNSYGHPTKRIMDLLSDIGCETVRTDLSGSIAVQAGVDALSISVSGQG